MLVNQERPRYGAVCSACARPLGASYLRHVSTQRRYCDYDCYRRYRQTAVGMPWPYGSSLETMTVLAAISAWSCMMQIGVISRSLTEAYLRAHDLPTLEGGDD